MRSEGITAKTSTTEFEFTETKGLDWDYWFERETWSSFMAFLLLTGALLLVALPFTMEVRQIPQTELRLAALFPSVFVLLFGILALSVGQAELAWGHRKSTLAQFIQIFSRLAFALMLTVPFWIAFLMGTGHSPFIVMPVLLHLIFMGAVLGMMGWRLALTNLSEIFQFNVKYVSLFGFLIVTFFYAPVRFLNPIWPLQSLINNDLGDSLAAAIGYYSAWMLIGAAFVYLIVRAIAYDATRERDGYGDALS